MVSEVVAVAPATVAEDVIKVVELVDKAAADLREDVGDGLTFVVLPFVPRKTPLPCTQQLFAEVPKPQQ